MADNYRPISLTSIFCKLFEKFVRKHLMDYFTEKGLITNAQYGFRSGRSLNLQLLKVIDDFTRVMNKHENVDDSVPHKRVVDVGGDQAGGGGGGGGGGCGEVADPHVLR